MDALVFTEWMEKLTEELGKKLEEVRKEYFNKIILWNIPKFNLNTFLNFFFFIHRSVAM